MLQRALGVIEYNAPRHYLGNMPRPRTVEKTDHARCPSLVQRIRSISASRHVLPWLQTWRVSSWAAAFVVTAFWEVNCMQCMLCKLSHQAAACCRDTEAATVRAGSNRSGLVLQDGCQHS